MQQVDGIWWVREACRVGTRRDKLLDYIHSVRRDISGMSFNNIFTLYAKNTLISPMVSHARGAFGDSPLLNLL